MPIRDLEAVFYAANVPIFEFREGMFLVCFDVGRCRFEFAMAPNIFLQAVREAERVTAAFHDGKAEVVSLKKRVKAKVEH